MNKSLPFPDPSAHSASSVPCVQSHSFLTLHYRLSGPAGDVINTFDGPPATLTLGGGQLAPALEACLQGLPEGPRATFDLPQGAVFGFPSHQLRQWLTHQALSDLGAVDLDYVVGDVLRFPTPDGQGQFAGTVRDRRPGASDATCIAETPLAPKAAVLLDFNHPLAGQPLHFEVHLIGVL